MLATAAGTPKQKLSMVQRHSHDSAGGGDVSAFEPDDYTALAATSGNPWSKPQRNHSSAGPNGSKSWGTGAAQLNPLQVAATLLEVVQAEMLRERLPTAYRTTALRSDIWQIW